MENEWLSVKEVLKLIKDSGVVGIQNAFKNERLVLPREVVNNRVYYRRDVIQKWIEHKRATVLVAIPEGYITRREAIDLAKFYGVPYRTVRVSIAKSLFPCKTFRVNGNHYKCVQKAAFEAWLRARQDPDYTPERRASIEKWAASHADFKRHTIEEIASEYLRKHPDVPLLLVKMTLRAYANRTDQPVYLASRRLLADLLQNEELFNKSVKKLSDLYLLSPNQIHAVKRHAKFLRERFSRGERHAREVATGAGDISA